VRQNLAFRAGIKLSEDVKLSSSETPAPIPL